MKIPRFLNPVVHNHWLFLAAGLVWSGVGIMLCALAYRWLSDSHSGWALWIGLGGLLLSLVVYYFGFAHIARSNIQRLHGFIEKVCLFAFFPVKSYLLMVSMMGLGMVLRSSPIPKHYLAFLYETIGGGLFLSSLHYYIPALQTARARISVE